MTDQRLELELRAWFRSEAPSSESAPAQLRAAVLLIPAASAPTAVVHVIRSRRRLVLLAAAALLAIGLIGGQLLGWGAPRPNESPAPVTPPPTTASGPASWIQAAAMPEPRSGDGYGTTTWAVLMADGRVLVAGGVADNRFGASVLQSAAIYDPASDSWSAAAPMTTPRVGQTMTLLHDGRVLVAGGTPGEPEAKVKSAELFDPTTGTWTPTGSLNNARAYHTATLLADGRVLIAGGDLQSVCVQQTCQSDTGGPAEIYDPATGQWSTAGRMLEQRVNMAAARLADDRVLVEGGGRLVGLNDAEIFDPATGNWQATTRMIAARNQNTAILMPDGRVLVVGGQITLHEADRRVPAEIYDPIGSTWGATSDPLSPVGNGPSTLLSNGQVLVSGGTGPMLYDPGADDWTLAGFVPPRTAAMQLLLSDGRVFLAGGVGDGAVAPASTSVLIYGPPR